MAKPSDRKSIEADDSSRTKLPPQTTSKTAGGKEKAMLGCFRRRECWWPTLRGFALFITLLLACGVAGLLGIHPFLAPNHSMAGGILVIEGWGPDYAMRAAAAEFARGTYENLFVTGGPLEWGAPLSEFKSYAEMGAATLKKMGAGTNITAVPAPFVRQDRTYTSAVALKQYLEQNNIPHANINLISMGPHARRSRLLYEKAFGKGTRVGIIALEPHDYDPRRWWRSSSGVRVVLSEVFAYAYVRLFFHPKPGEMPPQ